MIQQLKKIFHVFDFMERFCDALVGIILISMALMVTYQVVARYIFQYAPYWTEEIANIALMWVGLLGAAGALWSDTFLSLRIFVQIFPKSVQLWMRVIVLLILAVFAGYLTYYGISLCSQLMNASLSTLPMVPIGITYVVIPISGILLFVFALMKALGQVAEFYTGEPVVEVHTVKGVAH